MKPKQPPQKQVDDTDGGYIEKLAAHARDRGDFVEVVRTNGKPVMVYVRPKGLR